ncbi:ABC transporter permease [Halarcobacter anaerophilus]|uniref:ABC transporter permease n=1 Tax=Halarcobacter anaerophilus TaxID=877500 RepID=A0A4Q0XXS4_9BACT|nr:FtsX-like permease family protein [Halarcobacter anaerophilus]QDF30388.1 ABC transporter, permease protein [Halarcobacter anaerophilus]RXJ61524.1 ABC transporter permease [Halarcobacter anaerophilus]
MLSLSLKALKANRLKTILIFISLIFSITSIFLISSISNGVISMYSNMLKSDGDIIITQAKISDTFFSNVDATLIKKIEKFKEVKKVSALIVGASPVEKLPIVAVYGVSQNRFENYKIKQGLYPKKGEVLVGNSIYESLKNKKNIQIADKNFLVSGVYKSDIGFENGGVVLNLSDASLIFNKSASMLMVNSSISANIKQLIKKIESLSKDIEAKSTQNFVDNYNQFKIIKTSSNLIGFISFCMGLLGIVSIMSITVNQRKTEFGIKRAIGVSTKKIVAQIVCESSILGILSFITSLFISSFTLYFIKNSSLFHGYVNGEISFTLAFYLFICSLSMAVLGSIIPAINASKIDPIILMQGDKI